MADQTIPLILKLVLKFDCPICYETVSKRVTMPCSHAFCCECTKEWLQTCNEENKQVTCPMCRFLMKTQDEKQWDAFMYHHFVYQTNLSKN
jgi:hypothetical protein